MSTPVEIHFTPREIQLIAHLIKDESYKIIAQQLSISFFTVKNELAHLRTKIQKHSTHGIVAYALQHGFTTDEMIEKVFYQGKLVA